MVQKETGMVASYQQDKAFRENVVLAQISEDILQLAVGWIGKNLSPEDVFCVPLLEEWAEDNGYIKESQP